MFLNKSRPISKPILTRRAATAEQDEAAPANSPRSNRRQWIAGFAGFAALTALGTFCSVFKRSGVSKPEDSPVDGYAKIADEISKLRPTKPVLLVYDGKDFLSEPGQREMPPKMDAARIASHRARDLMRAALTQRGIPFLEIGTVRDPQVFVTSTRYLEEGGLQLRGVSALIFCLQPPEEKMIPSIAKMYGLLGIPVPVFQVR